MGLKKKQNSLTGKKEKHRGQNLRHKERSTIPISETI
jgi:hypothetical protein